MKKMDNSNPTKKNMVSTENYKDEQHGNHQKQL
jgi:hypothetical protein